MSGGLSERVKRFALECGADLVGICDSSMLRESSSELDRILPGHRAVVVIAVRHSMAALRSADVRVKQLDTVYAYRLAGDVACRVARMLEAESYAAVPIPLALPIDMSDGKKGMIGDVDLRRAAVLCGLGVYGRSGLLVTRQFDPRVRLSGVITDAPLEPDKGTTDFRRAMEEVCGSCSLCVRACPASALRGDGTVDKKRCSRHLFQYGLRRVIKLLAELFDSDPETRSRIIGSYDVREIWQTLIVGNYYCWECQAVCPIGSGRGGLKSPRATGYIGDDETSYR